jgi:hypothetical protein
MNWTTRAVPYGREACGLAVAALLFLASTAAAQSLAPSLGGKPQPIGTVPFESRYMTWIGSTTTQGDAVMNANTARTTYGVNGAGIKIGIISDSFNRLGGMNAGIASGDLPGVGNPNGFTTPVNIVKDDPATYAFDEGRGMAELIHDVAPGAQLLFHSAFNNTETSPGETIGVAINALVAAGANIIVDDVATLDMPAYQDGKAAIAAHNAFLSGVSYFSSAGNNANNAYEGVFNPRLEGTSTFHNFDANNNDAAADKDILRIGAVGPGGSVRASLWWDDPYPSVSGSSPTPTADIDFFLYDITAGNTLVSQSIADQLGGQDANEFVFATNGDTINHQYGVKVQLFAGALNKKLKIQVFGSSISDDDDTNSPTTFGQNSANGVVGVAAASVFNPSAPEPFTSFGPTTILRDANGNPLVTPEIRNAPQITGPDGGNTSFFPAFGDSPSDPDSFPNFFGTSASAPHVAAVAALVLQRAAQLGISLTPTQLYNLLFNSTVDITGSGGATPGFDSRTGWGRLDANLALAQLAVPEPGAIALAMAAIGLIVGHRQRRAAR